MYVRTRHTCHLWPTIARHLVEDSVCTYNIHAEPGTWLKTVYVRTVYIHAEPGTWLKTVYVRTVYIHAETDTYTNLVEDNKVNPSPLLIAVHLTEKQQRR